MGNRDRVKVVTEIGVDVTHPGSDCPNVWTWVENPIEVDSLESTVPSYWWGAKGHAISNISAPLVESLEVE